MAFKTTTGNKFGKNAFVSFDVQKFFFDRAEVQRALQKMQVDERAFRRYAMYLRRVARNSIRKVRAKPGGKAWRRPSAVNKPPRSRDNPQHRLRRILAGFDFMEGAMVVGPVFFRRTAGTTVPSIHEKAKRVTITRAVRRKSLTRAKSKRQALAFKRKAASAAFRRANPEYFAPVGRETRSVKYPPRPFMWPAALKTVDRFPDMYAKTVRLK